MITERQPERPGAFLASKIRTVFFDFDGTLVFHSPDSFDVIAEFCAEIDQPLSDEAIRLGRWTRHQYFVDPVIRQQMEQLSREELWRHLNRHLLEAIGVQGDLDILAAEITEYFGGVELRYHSPEPAGRTLSELRNRGYALGLITNRENVDRFHEVLGNTELEAQFDLILASGEVGVRKPEPGIFDEALERMRATAEQSLYVGDNYWADVVGAQRAGLTPVLLDPHRVFADADCLVIECIDELLALLPYDPGS
ncbi:MAG: HAD family hydrolase [Anaerolineae bacterium]|jgi:HAD superfamily hydrolase (TIGR01662 family)